MRTTCLRTCATTVLAAAQAQTYTVVDTGQERCYGDTREMAYPTPGTAFHGQDAQYTGVTPAYRDNADGKVSRAEFDGPQSHFPALDKDHDGYLTEAEAPPLPPARRPLR